MLPTHENCSWHLTLSYLQHLLRNPICLLQKCLLSCYFTENFLPSVTNLLSLSNLAHWKSGVLHSAFKQAGVTLLLNKPTLNQAQFENSQPVLLLPFMSKLLERTFCNQVLEYLFDPQESSFRKGHSTETVLLLVTVSLQLGLFTSYLAEISICVSWREVYGPHGVTKGVTQAWPSSLHTIHQGSPTYSTKVRCGSRFLLTEWVESGVLLLGHTNKTNKHMPC